MSTTTTYTGVRIVDMPDLGTVSDTSSVVGERAGSGRFGALALRNYTSLYTAPVTGSLSRSSTSRLGERISVKDFGAVGDGAANDTAAIQAAVTNTHGNVYFPAGIYKITNTIALPLTAGQAYRGAGIGLTILRPSTANMVLFSAVEAPGAGDYLGLDLQAEFSGFTIDAAATGITGIYLKFCRSVKIQDVRFAGCLYNANADQGSDLTVADCMSVGNAVAVSGQLRLWSTDDTNFIYFACVINYMVNCGLYEPGAMQGSINPAIYVRRAVSLRLLNCSGTNLNLGAPADFILLENNCQGCKIIGGTSVGARSGIIMQPGAGAQGFPSYTEIISHDIDAFSGTAIGLEGDTTNWPASMMNSIIGGKLTAPKTAGLFYIFARYQLQLTITGVQFQDYGGSGNGICFGISACNAVTISNCVGQYGQYVLQVIDPPGGGLLFTNNSFSNFTTPLVGTYSTWSARIVGNYSIFAPVTTPAVPASGTVVTNNTGTDVQVRVAGAATTIAINGVGFANVLAGGEGATVVVPANRTISLTYSSGAPAWIWTSLS